MQYIARKVAAPNGEVVLQFPEHANLRARVVVDGVAWNVIDAGDVINAQPQSKPGSAPRTIFRQRHAGRKPDYDDLLQRIEAWVADGGDL